MNVKPEINEVNEKKMNQQKNSEKNCEINTEEVSLDMESSSPLPLQNPEDLDSNPEEVMGSNQDHGGARPKQYSNVIVDDSPLQNQMEKNKECK